MGVLGQKVEGRFHYSPEFLVKEERSLNREGLGIAKVPPFYGFDVWNCYEFSFLNANGVPQTAILKIMYPSSSKYIVESKSLKLYLNSYNMDKIESVDEVVKRIKEDLSNLLECNVLVSYLWTTNELKPTVTNIFTELSMQKTETFLSLEEILKKTKKDIQCDCYKRNPDLLEISEGIETNDYRVHSWSLRSNCKVTGQPDWGDIYIYMSGDLYPTYDSLLKYIVSFRDEHHFHEEIVEMIYKDLLDKFAPKDLLVYANYTRRGGIDINPIRATDPLLLTYFAGDLLSMNMSIKKSFRQ